MMRSAFLPLAATALALPAGPLAAAEVTLAPSGPVVELSVFESVAVAPDIATIGAGVTTEADSASAAMQQNAAQMSAVIARIKALGIAERDIQTTGISLNARYDYDPAAQRPVFRGYQAANRVSVKLRQIADVGRVLDALVAAGVNDLSGPSFAIENDEAAKDEARKRALDRATARAEAYARSLGYGGAKVLAIAETLTGRGPMPETVMIRADAGKVSAVPPVEPGLVEAGVSLSITYELVKGAGQ
ncbi:MAG: SIMPL domain-containing protein [Erythrobacter cryptus]